MRLSSYRTIGFKKRFEALPDEIKLAAQKQYLLWRGNPAHPSLDFKSVPGSQNIWRAKVTRGYRAVCMKVGKDFVWDFIGSHEDYERYLSGR